MSPVRGTICSRKLTFFCLQALAHTFDVGGGKGDMVEAAGVLDISSRCRARRCRRAACGCPSDERWPDRRNRASSRGNRAAAGRHSRARARRNRTPWSSSRSCGSMVKCCGPPNGMVLLPENLDQTKLRSASTPSIQAPTVSKWLKRPCNCWVTVWMSRKRRSSGWPSKIAVAPAVL